MSLLVPRASPGAFPPGWFLDGSSWMVPLCDLWGTSARPLRDLYRTSARPLCDLCATSARPLRDLCRTSARPLRDLCATSGGPLRDLCATSTGTLLDLCATSLRPLDRPATAVLNLVRPGNLRHRPACGKYLRSRRCVKFCPGLPTGRISCPLRCVKFWVALGIFGTGLPLDTI